MYVILLEWGEYASNVICFWFAWQICSIIYVGTNLFIMHETFVLFMVRMVCMGRLFINGCLPLGRNDLCVYVGSKVVLFYLWDFGGVVLWFIYTLFMYEMMEMVP